MQKIKLTIAGRVYPLNVNKDDESQIRESAKSINSMINHFEKNYAVKDKQDVLAMCALQIAVQSIKDFDFSKKENNDLNKKLLDLNEFLKKNSVN